VPVGLRLRPLITSSRLRVLRVLTVTPPKDREGAHEDERGAGKRRAYGTLVALASEQREAGELDRHARRREDSSPAEKCDHGNDRLGRPRLGGAQVERSNGPFLGGLGWNSYGTEGAQRMENVRLSKRPKMA